ncbi:hypothetical protein NDU88_000863 [Pleurodeles waltl]|uniref:Uncharacterized protein n=1 Tax=Pleurodeles waltl TaxID=8319 RepID=A0AAV7TGQ8_PLEWA|nr:hypothetical protein NDU88_000863 [Pleurodeles waltl]
MRGHRCPVGVTACQFDGGCLACSWAPRTFLTTAVEGPVGIGPRSEPENEAVVRISGGSVSQMVCLPCVESHPASVIICIWFRVSGRNAEPSCKNKSGSALTQSPITPSTVCTRFLFPLRAPAVLNLAPSKVYIGDEAGYGIPASTAGARQSPAEMG